MSNIKFANAQQANVAHNYINTKEKLYIICIRMLHEDGTLVPKHVGVILTTNCDVRLLF